MRLLDLPGALGARAALLLPMARRLGPPLLAGLVVAGVTVWLYRALEYRENVQIYRTMQAEAARLKSEAAERIAARILVLRGMAQRWERKRQPDHAEWEADASRLVAHDFQYRGVEWREPSLDVRWSAPFAARLPQAVLDPGDDELRRQVLEPMQDRPEPSISRSVVLASGERQFLVCAPMFAADRGIGFIVGVMRARDLMDALLSEEIARGYAVAVYEDPYLIFGPAWLEGGDEAALASDAELRVDDLAWRLVVWPSRDLVKRMHSRAPEVMLAFGLVMAVWSSIAVHQLRGRRDRAVGVEATSARASVPVVSAPVSAEPRTEPGDAGSLAEPAGGRPSPG